MALIEQSIGRCTETILLVVMLHYRLTKNFNGFTDKPRFHFNFTDEERPENDIDGGILQL